MNELKTTYSDISIDKTLLSLILQINLLALTTNEYFLTTNLTKYSLY